MPGIGAGSKLGILFKGGISIEALKNIKAIIMDKTGTITKGNFVVQKITAAADLSEDQIIAMAAACEASSTHPIALSIMEEAAKRTATVQKAESIEEISGKGIKAKLAEGEALCGNRKLMDQFGIDISRQDSGEGTEIFLALGGKFAGHITIADTIKSDAVDAIAAIKADGLIPAMLTGDAAGSANAVARTVGIADANVHAQLLPEDKLNALKEIRKQNGAVLFVGDGINDAPVLAGASVFGAAMGSGADAAIEAADVVFMNSSVSAIPQAIECGPGDRTYLYAERHLCTGSQAAGTGTGVCGLCQHLGCRIRRHRCCNALHPQFHADPAEKIQVAENSK